MSFGDLATLMGVGRFCVGAHRGLIVWAWAMLALVSALAAPLDRAHAQAGFTDLSVQVTDSPNPVAPDGDITYTVTVTNHGPDDAPGSLNVQNGGTLRFQSLSAPAGWSCTTAAVGDLLSANCSHASLTAGSQHTFTIVAQADDALNGPNDATILTDFTVSTPTADMLPGNDSYDETTAYVTANADLSVTLTAPASANVGAQITYNYTAANAGPDSAVNVGVTAAPQPGMTFVSVTAPGGWSCTTPAVGVDGPVGCTKATMASGASANFTMVFNGPASGTEALAVASIVSQTEDPDPANNGDDAATQLTGSAPQITSVSPSSGPASGGTSVTINGTNLTGATAVSFGGTAATSFTVNSAIKITAVAPLRAAGTVSVAVTTGAGTATSANAFTFLAAPQITSVSPSSGAAAGGTPVTINGANFGSSTSDITAVTFGGVAATTYSRISASQISATTPAGSGAADVAVTTGGGTATSASAFTYIAAPQITGMSPSTGSTAGGASVTISGSNFTGAALTVDGATVTPTSASDSSIVFTTPAHAAAAVNVAVTTAGGTATSTFTYAAPPPAPQITSVSPSSGPAAGGTSVTISGSNFTGATLTVDGAAVTPTSANASTIVFTTPAHAAGAVDVAVTTAGGAATSTSAFTYLPPAPTPQNVTTSTPYMTAKQIQLVANNGFSSATVATPPQKGAVVISGTVATYTPNEGELGTDTFTYTATGPGGTSVAVGTVTVSITVAGLSVVADVTVAPFYAGDLAVAILTVTNPNSVRVPGLLVSLGGSSVPNVTSLEVSPGGGSAQGLFTATLDDLDPGEVVTVKASLSDQNVQIIFNLSTGDTGLAVKLPSGAFVNQVTASGTALPSSSRPTAAAMSVDVAYETAQTIQLNTTNATSVEVTTVGTLGTVQVSGTSVTYTPPAGHQGADSFKYLAVAAGGGKSAQATVTINVQAPAAPTVQPITVSAPFVVGQTVTIPLSDAVMGYLTSIEKASDPAHGSVTITTTGTTATYDLVVTAVYTIAADSGPVETFTFTVKGAGDVTVQGTATINLSGGLPGLAPLTSTTLGGVAVTVDLTSAATGGPFIDAEILETPASGTATLVQGGTADDRTYQLQFTPQGAFTGQAVVTYRLKNRFGWSEGQVVFTVTPRPNLSLDPAVVHSVTVQVKMSIQFATSQMSNVGLRMFDAGLFTLASDLVDAQSGNEEEEEEEDAGDGDEKKKKKKKKKKGEKKSFSNNLRFNGLTDLPAPNLDGPFPGLTSRLEAEHARDDWFLDTAAAAEARSNGPAAPSGGVGEYDGLAGAWVGGAVTFGRREGGTGKAQLDILSSGVTAGVDFKLNPSTLLGAAVGYGRQITDIGNDGTQVEGRSWVGMVYGAYSPGDNIFVHGILGAGEIDLENKRAVAGELATGEREGKMFFGSAAVGFNRREAGWIVSPYGRLEITYADLGAYTEQGAGLYNLHYASADALSLTGALGVRGQTTYELRSGIVTPSAHVEVLHDFDDEAEQQLQYADWLDGPSYLVRAPGENRTRVRLGIGNAAILHNGWTVGVDAEAELGRDQALGTFRLKAEKSF